MVKNEINNNKKLVAECARQRCYKGLEKHSDAEIISLYGEGAVAEYHRVYDETQENRLPQFAPTAYAAFFKPDAAEYKTTATDNVSQPHQILMMPAYIPTLKVYDDSMKNKLTF